MELKIHDPLENRQKWQMLTSAHLQIIAVVTMVIDHIGALFFTETAMFRVIGRLAFPLYCLMVAEGFIHTSNRKKYFLRLLGFAALTIVPFGFFDYFIYNVEFTWAAFGQFLAEDLFANVIFELAMGFAALWGVYKGKGWLLLVPAALVLSEVLDLMYGWYGILLIICFYVFRHDRALQAVSLVAVTLAYSWGRLPFFPYYWVEGAFAWDRFFWALPRVTQAYAAAAAVPVLFYNGQRGRRLPRYAGYVFYPAHLLVLALLYILLQSGQAV